MKTCPKCKTPYPATSEYFGANRRSKDGFLSWCRRCYRDRGRESIAEISESRRQRKLKDPCKMRGQALRQAMKTRAQKAGVAFDSNLFTAEYLTDWLRRAKGCSCCGVELLQTYTLKHTVAKNSPSFDRVIPSLGYVQGNVHLLCHRCNSLKSNMTLEELERLVNWVRAAQKTALVAHVDQGN